MAINSTLHTSRHTYTLNLIGAFFLFFENGALFLFIRQIIGEVCFGKYDSFSLYCLLFDKQWRNSSQNGRNWIKFNVCKFKAFSFCFVSRYVYFWHQHIHTYTCSLIGQFDWSVFRLADCLPDLSTARPNRIISWTNEMKTINAFHYFFITVAFFSPLILCLFDCSFNRIVWFI